MPDFLTVLIVDAAQAMLGLLSAITWILILHKTYTEWCVSRDNRRFFAPSFWGHAVPDAGDAMRVRGPKARIAQAAFDVLSMRQSSPASGNDTLAAWDRRDTLERFVGRQVQRERRDHERGLTLLASIANIAPFVGLFGTVFGVIHALHSIAVGASTGVAGVAAPVGQALVATGIGIMVAVPAAFAYNLFVRRVQIAASVLEDYAIEVIELAERHFASNTPSTGEQDRSVAVPQAAGVSV